MSTFWVAFLFFYFIFSLLPFFLSFSLFYCHSNKPKTKKQQSVLQKSVSKLGEKKAESQKKTTTKSTSAEEGRTQKTENLKTAQSEDSFDRLKPRQMFVERYNEIHDAPKVNRHNADYDTLKMIAVDDDFAKELAATS